MNNIKGQITLNKYNQGSFIPIPVAELNNMDIEYKVYYFNKYINQGSGKATLFL